MRDVLSEDTTYNLWLLLRRASYTAFRAREKELNQYGISNANSGVLFLVHELGRKATPAEISRQLFREPHSVSGLLSRMEKDGLVRRSKDLHKKNMVRVDLTEKGRKAYAQAKKRESIYRILSVLSKSERRQLASSLTKIREKALKELE